MIVVGFDPGAWIGYAVVDMRDRVPRVLVAGKVRCENLDGRDILDLALGVLPPPSIVAVEKVLMVYPRKGFGAPMATALANATRVEGRILEASSNKGWPTAECTAREWREALTGLAAPSDAVVKATLSRRVEQLQGLNAHSRDAVGVAVFCGLRAKLEAAKVASKRSGAGA